MKNVAIFGCGPAGLLAAHAANLSGWDFLIYSRKQMSPLYGAQYLHAEIDGLYCGDPQVVEYNLVGTPEQYRHKVYGDNWDGTVSPEDFMERHNAWDLRSTYKQLWDTYSDMVVPVEFEQGGLMTIGGDGSLDSAINKFDLIISTIPRTIWDSDESHFEASYIWALGDGDYERVHMHRPKPFSVICDGTKENQWYRVSNIFGYCTMEWPQWWNNPFASVTPPARGAARVAKPLAYTGNAATDFIHLGRYAQWTKAVLTSDVFFAAMKVLANDKIS